MNESNHILLFVSLTFAAEMHQSNMLQNLLRHLVILCCELSEKERKIGEDLNLA